MNNKILVLMLIVLTTATTTFSATFEGGVTELGQGSSNVVIDKSTNKGIGGAKVYIPKLHYSTTTDENGVFQLNTNIDGTSILAVEKENYRPFSMTVDKLTSSAPLTLAVEKTNANDIVIDKDMYHLGDDNYSDLSANAGQFNLKSAGPFYTKLFDIKNIDISKTVYFVIGSIIGIDTALARSMGQNQITNSYASPPEVFFNGNKIAEIELNGDNQKIKLPRGLIRVHDKNEITIKTGRNMLQTAYVDYDDIEFMNLSIEN